MTAKVRPPFASRELASGMREQKLAEKRWKEARASLGKEAFAPPGAGAPK